MYSKIIEIVVTDERGSVHCLRCAEGLTIIVEGGAISAITQTSENKKALYVAQGRWITYRLSYA